MGSKEASNTRDGLPGTGFVRLKHIIGDPKCDPPIPPIIPVSKSTWWAGVKSGRFPRPLKLSERITVWKVGDIRELIGRQVMTWPEKESGHAEVQL